MEKEKKKFYKKWWFWTIIIIFIFVISSNSTSTTKPTNDLNKNNITINTNNKYLNNLKILPLTITSGDNSTTIGTAYVIKADKEKIINFTTSDWIDFKKNFIDKYSDGKWLTISFNDGTGIIFNGYIGTLCNVNEKEQYCEDNPANELEYIEIFTDSNEVRFDFPENGNTTNYFVGLE